MNIYAFFLNKEEKKILKSNIILNKNTFFNNIDDIYLGQLISYNSYKISNYYLIGKAFMTTYLKSTPNCLRIVNQSEKNINMDIFILILIIIKYIL